MNRMKDSSSRIVTRDARKVLDKFNIHSWLKKKLSTNRAWKEHTST